MIKKHFLFFIVLLFSTVSYAKESIDGNYSKTPHGEIIIKISKIKGVYFMELSPKALSDLPGFNKKNQSKVKWYGKEPGETVPVSTLIHKLGKDWKTKVKGGLLFKRSGSHLLRLQDNYKLDAAFSTSRKGKYAQNIDINTSTEQSKYVYTLLHWYFDVYKQQ